MGSLERECGSLETCGLCDCPDPDSDLFGEGICGDCLTLAAESGRSALDGDEDYVLDARGFNHIIVHDDGIDGSEIISTAVGLVPPVHSFARTAFQHGSAEVASPH